MHRYRRLEQRVNDAPGLLDIVFAGEQRPVPRHRIGQHALVGVLLVRAGVAARQELGGIALSRFLGIHDVHADGNLVLGTDLKAKVIRRGLVVKDRRRALEPRHDLRAGHGERLAGADVERHALPAPVIDGHAHRREGLGL
jgi:hypothetical protein